MKTVIITGASSGFGKLLVQQFLKAGDYVIATGRKLSERADVLAEERRQYPQTLKPLNLDLTDAHSLETFSRFCQSLPQIDILINNAGYGLFGALEDSGEAQIRQQMEVNFFGTVLLTKALLPTLISSKAKIFNFSSVLGFTGFPLTSLYCASKFAVDGFTEALRFELHGYGVQLCSIQPGGYATKFGDNSQWAEGQTPRFRGPTAMYKELRIKMARANKQDPIEVAEGVYRLSLRPRLPARKIFGKDAWVARISRAVLPNALYILLNQKIFTKLLTK